MFNSPEARDDPALWDVAGDGEETFLWNSSRADSSNAWLHGWWFWDCCCRARIREFQLFHPTPLAIRPCCILRIY